MVVGNRSGFCRYLLSKPKYQPTTDTLIIRTSLKFVISPDFGGNLSFPEMSYFLPLCRNNKNFRYINHISNYLCSPKLYDGKLNFNIFCALWQSGNLMFYLLTRLFRNLTQYSNIPFPPSSDSRRVIEKYGNATCLAPAYPGQGMVILFSPAISFCNGK